LQWTVQQSQSECSTNSPASLLTITSQTTFFHFPAKIKTQWYLFLSICNSVLLIHMAFHSYKPLIILENTDMPTISKRQRISHLLSPNLTYNFGLSLFTTIILVQLDEWQFYYFSMYKITHKHVLQLTRHARGIFMQSAKLHLCYNSCNHLHRKETIVKIWKLQKTSTLSLQCISVQVHRWGTYKNLSAVLEQTACICKKNTKTCHYKHYPRLSLYTTQPDF